MKLTITTLGDHISTIEVSDEMEVENLKALCSIETGFAVENMAILFNGNALSDNKKTVSQCGIKDGDMLLIQENNQTQNNANNPFPNLDFSSIAVPNMNNLDQLMQNPINRLNEATNIYETLRSNPEQVSVLRINNPRLADAFDKGLDEFAKILSEQQEAQAKEKQRRLRMLLADPFDSEAQQMIAEEIRREQIDHNMENAMEYLPESFGEVTMLYIDCKVNGHAIKAFVDSGAQSTIMSKACAERCSILRLIDNRWSGIARGVGTQRILGKIHLVQLEISGDFLPSSFMILENQPMDMLLGLDMLRRYQCTIDLKSHVLRIGTTGTETRFLNENEIPKHLKEEESDLQKAIQSSIRSMNSASPTNNSNSKFGSIVSV